MVLDAHPHKPRGKDNGWGVGWLNETTVTARKECEDEESRKREREKKNTDNEKRSLTPVSWFCNRKKKITNNQRNATCPEITEQLNAQVLWEHHLLKVNKRKNTTHNKARVCVMRTHSTAHTWESKGER